MVTIILLPLLFNAQSVNLKEVTNNNLLISGNETSVANKILSAENGDYLFFTTRSRSVITKNRCIYRINKKSYQIDTLKITSSKNVKSFIDEMFFSFDVTDDKIIILTDMEIIVLTYEKNVISFSSKIKNTYYFNYIKKLNNKDFFLYVNYNFHPLDAIDKHVWAKYNLDENKITGIKKMDETNSIFSHSTNSWVSVNNGIIAYANTINYKIKLYDSNFNCIDSIISNKLDNNSTHIEEIRSENNYSKEGITNMIKIDDINLKRIQKIFLNDSHHILVMVKSPKTFKCEFDFWQKKDNKWQLNESKVFSNFYEEGQVYHSENDLLEGFYGNVNGISYDQNNNFNIIYFPYMKNVVTTSFNLETDYNDVLNKMVNDKSLYYGIKKYKITYK